MRSEKQHIDDFFRQKDEAFTPDVQHATAHWQQMQKQLTDPGPGASANNKTIKKIGRFLGGLLTIAIIALLTIKVNRSNKKDIPKTKQQAAVVAPEIKPITTPDTLSNFSQPINRSVTIETNSVTPAGKQKQPPAPAMTFIAPPITSAEAFTHDTHSVEYNSEWSNHTKTFETKGPKPNAQTLLSLFYDRLKKEEEVFYIEAGRATTITAKEGTILTIPAHTFTNKSGIAKGKVKIVLREYYKYEDILAARLSTTSNGKQLVTGGMLHISAEQDGEAVKVAPEKAITVSVPTNDYNANMMLFRGVEQPGEISNNTTLNWIRVGPFVQSEFPINMHDRMVKVLNLQKVEPASVTYGKKTTAKFYVSPQIDIPKTALIAPLKQRFGTYYDIIKLKKLRKKSIHAPTMYEDNSSIIDSVRLDMDKALKWRLLPKNDSIYYAGLLKQDSIERAKRIKSQKHYQFFIDDLGWINCDFFRSFEYTKINLTVDVGKDYNISNCFSQLVFTRFKSVLNLYSYNDNKIRYENMPEKEPVVLIMVKVKDDTVMSCFRPLNITKTEVTDLVFEPTTPEQFKQKLHSLFASQQQ
jgi:hypothetical protein